MRAPAQPAKDPHRVLQQLRAARLFEHTSFTFLGYASCPRLARNRAGNEFVGFLPAIEDDERKPRVIRS